MLSPLSRNDLNDARDCEFLAVLACSLFTEAGLYMTFVEHPARIECGVEIAATEFASSCRRASVMQATLAALVLLFSIAA